MIYVHIGAGVGDQDPGANFRDGFTEFVKKSNDLNKEIIVVEANPSNISKLKIAWKDYSNVKIFNFAVSTKKNKNEKIKFYYSLEDVPHYQVFSNDINHILKYYKNSEKIKSKFIKSKDINLFLEENFKGKIINYFSIDIEGMDFDVIKEINLKKYIIINFSFEHLHLNFNEKIQIFIKFLKNGYSYNGVGYNGVGIDHNNFDWTFKKGSKIWNNFIFFILIFISKKQYKYLDKLIFKF